MGKIHKFMALSATPIFLFFLVALLAACSQMPT